MIDNNTKLQDITQSHILQIDCCTQFSETSIVIGCNYHTKWQKHSAMRFVLKEIKGDKARLITRTSGRDFWANLSDLIFIMSKHNIDKAKRLST
jgi:hypothetical protein